MKEFIKRPLKKFRILNAKFNFTLENKFYTISIDETTGGIKNIYDKELHQELVDSTSHFIFNQYIYENISSLEGRSAIWAENSSEPLWSHKRKKDNAEFRRYTSSLKSVEVLENREVKKIILTISGKGCSKIISEIILHSSTKRIDIINTLKKEENLEPEAVYFAFPFNFRKPKIKINGPGKAVFQPEKEQLPNTVRDYYSIEDWVIISDNKKSVVWVSPNAPLIQISRINTGRWLKKLKIENGSIFSYLMNNLWFTNFKACQSGKVSFCYFLTSQKGQIKNSFAHKFSLKSTIPIFYSITNHFFKFDQNNIHPLCFKKSEDGKGFILRVKETDGKKTCFNLKCQSLKKIKIFLAKPTEEKIKPLPYESELSYSIKPFEILTFYFLIDGEPHSEKEWMVV